MKNTSHKNIEDILALTPLQEGMLFHYLKEPGSDQYFEQLCLEILGKIDAEYFERAWDTVIETNETLRTVFRWEKIEKPTQIILKKHKLKVIFHDLSNKDQSGKKRELEEIKNKDRGETFDLQQPSFRVILCKLEEAKNEVIISNHHILFDGWSNGIILKEFFRTYNDLIYGKELIKPVKTKFKEFIKWIQNQDKKKQEQYWREYLHGFDSPSELPIKRRGKSEEKGDVENYSIRLEEETQGKLEQFVDNKRITIATVINSAWGILLQRYCNTGDILFGVTVSGRNVGIKGIEEMVGLFINTIPLRVKVSGGEKLIDVVLGIERESHNREDYEHTPLPEIGAHFETFVAVENYPLDNRLNQSNSPLTIESYSIVEKTHYDLAVGVMLEEEITVNFYYNRGMYERETIETLAGHFKRIVQQIIDDSMQEVSQLEIISEEEKTRILYDFNDQGITFPGAKTIHGLFSGQAEKTPNHIALVERSTQLTYDELNERSNSLAHELQEKGIEPGAIVGIQIERTIEMIVGILGILKTGAAYLPLNPKNPQERTDFMLQDSNAKILLTACSSQPLNLSTSQLLISFSSVSSVAKYAYIIYTSGSTGNPKGVPITHANFCPLMHWGYKHLGLTSDDRSVQNLSYYFDWSVWEIFIALTSGASLYMAPNEIILDTERYIDFIERNRITVLHITPTHFQTLIHRERKLNTLRHLCIGAEKLTYDLVRRSIEIVNENCRIYNMYGPTEATIMSAVLEIERSNFPNYKELTSVPIGKTLGNNILLVLDRNLKLSPLNIPGELYIGGEGVASGYLNNAELTNEKFIMPSATRNPFEKGVLDLPKLFANNNPKPKTQNPKLYRTGDLARWLKDGTVEYLGRIDQQVKVRGYRIEPGEIENRLLEHEAVKDAIVVCRQYKTGENYLSAYVVLQPEQSTCTANNLKDYLLLRLPDYMVPSYIVKLERMPLNPNGKVDIKALPEPGIIEVGEYKAARNKLEKALVEIWGRVLGMDTGRIGIEDDFFEMGGHSLNVTSLIGRIHKELKIEIPFTEIFVNSTIKELATYIGQKEESRYGEIPQTEEKEYYPLSSSQKRMYLLHQMDPDSIVYNIHGVMSIEGEVNTGKFENVFLKLIERHESLRTSFEIIDEEPVQRILRKAQIKLADEDTEIGLRPFDLSIAPLLRVGLIKQGEERHLLVIEMSHIISDGASMGVLIKEFTSLYKGEELPGLRIQYKDYSQWNIERSKSEALRRQRAYWMDRMEGDIPVLNLPTDYERPVVQSFEGAHYRFEIEGEESRALKAAALEYNTTIFGILTAIYSILLSKLSGQEEIIIGTPVLGRKSNYEEISQIIGMFVNTLALRIYPTWDKKFSELVKEVSVTASEANENQEYPFEDLVESVVKKRDVGRNPIFDVMLSMQNLDLGEIKIPGLELKSYPYDDQIAKFDMVLICDTLEDQLIFTVEYSVKLFTKETIKRNVGYFQKIVKEVLKEREQRIGEIEIVSEEEKKRILNEFNNPGVVYSEDKTIHELFRGQAEKTPDSIALVGASPCCPSSLTYKELDKQTDSLAHELQEKGIEAGDIVGIQVERSIEMIVGILGILKTGAAYLPINPKNPQKRTDFMLQDSNAKILLTADSSQPLNLSTSQLLISFSSVSSVCSVRKNLLPAYIIYTSGSTGNPKGVLITHSNFSPLIHWGYRHLGIGTKDRALQNLAYYFDWSVWEIFITLTTGASLYMVSEDVLLNLEKCVEFILKNVLTVLHITPTQYHYLIGATQKPVALRYLFIGAEKLTYELTKRSIESVDERCRVFNMYGPTEATIISAVLAIDRKDLESYSSLSSVPIGKPTGNATLLIVDKYMKLCPVNIVGELYIGGEGVAPGYLNNPELTAERFINPKPKTQNLKLYRTGDLARWLSDGSVEFLGRLDHQVKIRGYRIELGEIENRILAHEGIKEGVVLAKDDGNGNRYLCAYVVEKAPISTNSIREYLLGKLPDYMVPSIIVIMEKMPLSPTGKIDLKSLPEPGGDERESYVAPRNEAEERLVEIWSETLGIEKDKIGIDSNFFEMGGHSLKATVLGSKIHKALEVKIPLVTIIQTPTVRGLAEYIKIALKDKYTPIETVEEREYYPLSNTQKRFFIFQQMNPRDISYNIMDVMIFEGQISREKFEIIFRELVDRHEGFRASFRLLDSEPVQRFHNNVEFGIEYIDSLPQGSDPSETMIESLIRPFDLTKPPLVRVVLIKVENEKHIFMADMHHIIADGVSSGIFIKEFLARYRGDELPTLKTRYRDYLMWMKGKKKQTGRQIQENIEVEAEEVLNLPLDYPRPPAQDFEGNTIEYTTGRELNETLVNLTLKENTTMYMLLLSAFNVFLSKLCGQETIVVGSPIAGRIHADIQDLVGLFINTLVLKNFPEGKKRFSEFLAEVSANALDAFENQDFQYEELLNKLSADRTTGGNPLFDVMLVLQNMELPEIEIPGVKVTRNILKQKSSKFDITLYCEESSDSLRFTWEYRVRIFKESTIHRFISCFHKVLSEILENPDKKIVEIEIVSDTEKRQILNEFNDTMVPYPKDKTVYELIEAQAQRTPEKIAVVHLSHQITYDELNRKSNRWARLIRAGGIQANTIVGIMMERSIEMIVGILAILKSGGAYLPIDPEYPTGRIMSMLENSGVSLILTNSGVVEGKYTLLKTEESEEKSKELSAENLDPISGPGDLIYVIFTSGSTGKPKGAGVFHRGFVNLMSWFVNEFGLKKEDKNLLLTSSSFDLTQKNLYASLIKGGEFHITGMNYFEPRLILREIQDHRIRWINCTPSMFYKMVEYEESSKEKRLESLRYVFLGGEPISMTMLISWSESEKCNARIVNTYGPTECTDICASFLITEPRRFMNEVIPLGKPMYNVQLYVMSKYWQLQPVGIAGELLIAGEGVGFGYIGDPQLTAEKFISFTISDPKPKNQNSKLYRTGDLVKWLPDGNIEFLGRIDYQVKIRGFRIELGEIESSLIGYKNIKEALVIAKAGNSGDKYLCAYVVPEDIKLLEESELREYMSNRLPGYMVPSYFVIMERFPLNPNGKVDRKALPEPDMTGNSQPEPPRTETETELAEIWSDVLGMEKSRIGIDDNFFRLGGHSLKAIELIGKTYKKFSVEIPIGELFSVPTIRGLARYLGKTVEGSYSSIEPVEEKEYYTLSSAQKRMYVLYLMDIQSTKYNIPYAVEMVGHVDVDRLDRVFKQVIQRHESLRTSFEVINEEPVQRIHEDVDFAIEYFNLATENTEDTEKKNHHFIHPFNLTKAPLFRVGLIWIEEEKHLLMVDMSHIISDGVSMVSLIGDFTSFYSGKELSGMRLQYKDYADWENREKGGENHEEQGVYWRKEFEGEIPVLELPTDYGRPIIQSFEGNSVNFEINREIIESLKALTLKTETTLNMVLLALYDIFLSKISGREDIVVGTPVAGRRHTDLENIIGMFVNTLALRNCPSGEKTFIGFLYEVKKKILKALENQDYQYEELVEQLSIRRDIGRNPLFDTMFALQNMEFRELEIPGLKLAPYEYENKTSKFDLTLIVVEEKDKLVFTFEYCVKLFKLETIERFIDYFKKIVTEVVESKNRKISEIEIITEEEKNRILNDFNNPEEEYPVDKTIHELFRGQAEKTPDHIAVVEKRIQITYHELNEKSNNLAHELQERGIEPGDIVGIKVERSLEMIVGILGILKTGAAYLPINPKNPQDRTDFMLQDSNAKILLTACSAQPLLSFSSVSSVCSVRKNLLPAYIIYTSGSTGNPKGVTIMHSNFSPLIHWGYLHLGIGTKDRALQNLAYYFDWSVWEIFITLTTGASLYMVSEDVLLNPEKCIEFILKNELTMLHITPTQYHYLVGATQKPKTLRYLFIGAEKLTYELTKRSIESVDERCRVFNMYGPTEATIISAVLEIERKDLENYSTLSSAPIGRPTGNATLLIVDKYMKLCPVNIIGELYIGGDGVANGYLNNPELTAERFINPKPKTQNSKLYRTGDLARWLPDGNVEFLGRIDHQVKIRGYRIELGEIENALLKYESVREAIVKVKGDNLYAYIVAGPEHSTHEIKEYLSGKLPGYMVPSAIVKLDKMPLSPTGKIDFKSLPEPGVEVRESYVAPRNEVEAKLVEIWSETLGIEKEKIGIDANFFEMGGHSLTATLLISKIHKAFNANVPLMEIFITPNIRGLGEYITRESKERYIAIEPVEEREYYELSSAQRRIYLLQRMEEGGTTYNISVAWTLEGALDKNKLESAFDRLIDRHESLRTTFEMIEEEPVQRIYSEVDFKIDCLSEDTESTEDKIHHFICPFNLMKAPLMRVGLIRIEEEKHILMVDLHHIISDGMSAQVLANNFSVLYAGEELAENRLQYKDYAEWQKSAKGSESLLNQGAYWKKEFEGEIPVLDLPADYARPAIQSFEGDRINFEICREATESLKALALETGATLYMVLLGIYTIFLSKVSGREEIVIGTPVAGRRHADLERIMGMFVNTLALRSNPTGSKQLIDFLHDVKEKTLKGLENQDYQYEELVEQLSIKRDISRNPLFDTMFTLQSVGIQAVKIPGLKLKPYEYENKTSKFDLTLIGVEGKDKLEFTFEYCAKLFKLETIERFIEYFKNIVKEITKNKDREISEIETITEEEKNRILNEFNNPKVEYPEDKTIHELFRGQAEKTPDSTALVGIPSSLTYKELDKQSDALAHELQERGIEPGDIVGIKVERSLDMIVGILGILKTGAAYLPINPKNPQERTDFMMQDSNAKIVLTACSAQPLISFSSVSSVCSVRKNSLPAYIIYTSGSTGNPKGVSITHSNFSPLIHWGYRHLGIGTKDRALQNLAYYFDWSVWEIFITLTTGASLYMVSEDVLLNPDKCVEFILKNVLTVLHITPTQYHYIVGATQKPTTLRYLFIGAEKLTYELTKQSIESVDERCRVFNMYGPTEATIISAVLEIDRKNYERYELLSSVPIGKPTGNATLLIVDKYMKLCPVNIIGELYIGGAGVANGYLNNPELTAEKFIPFVHRLHRLHGKENNNPKPKTQNPKLYRTGDLARWLSNGTVEFLRRIDHQVKIRGYRIELGEIENAFLKHEAVREAAVKVKGENLYAYIVAGPEHSTHEIKKYLSGKLPDYMVPSAIIKLDKMPLGPTGKIDLKSLPEPGLEVRERYMAPRNEVEAKLVEIWSETLGIEKEKIGIDSNFFEMGGHSLTATLLISKIHKAFNVNAPLAEIFITPYIRGLGEYIKRETKERYVSIKAVEEREYYELSSAQRRIYLLQRMDNEGVAYNIPAAWILEGALDKNKLENTFTQLIKRHESLRTAFEIIEEEPVQRIYENVEFAINYLAIEDTERGLRPFNLTKAPLMRVGLTRIEEEKYIMMVEIHHIISDGLSVVALIHDFTSLYPGKEMEEMTLQYKDYAEWRRGEKGSESLLNQGAYWKNEFEGEIPVLELPTDFGRPTIQSFEGNSINFEISKKITGALKELTIETGATLYMVLLALYSVFLSKVGGREDIVIGTPVAGRRHADLERIMGMFVNTLALRNNPSGEKKFIDYLYKVKEKTLKALENQDYQYEELVEQLSINRDISRNPLFDTMFTLQNTGIQKIEIPGLKLTPYENENKTSKFDLTLSGGEAEEKLLLTFEYCVKLFKQETIERFIDYFKNIVKEVTENKDRKISEIEIITGEEKNRILYDFNNLGVEYPGDKTIHELFRGQAEKTPDHIALVGCHVSLTYKELDKQSNALTHELQEKGIQPGDIVGIMVERSLEMIVGILGILKTGAAYLPLNPKNPQERTDFMLKDSNAKILLTTCSSQPLNFSTSQLLISVSSVAKNRLPATSYAYVIYTSGSTGEPKGVPITHANFSPLIHWGYEHLGLTPDDRSVQNLSYYFDWSVWEIFIALTSGASLYMVSSDLLLDSEKYIEMINRYRITVLHITPTHFQSLIQQEKKLSSLRHLSIGAEKLTYDLVKRSFEIVDEACRVYNMYGPTETTIMAAVLEIERSKLSNYKELSSVPIGRTLGNNVLLVLDRNLNLCPLKIPGELYIEGSGVASGYLNNPELTAEKFIPFVHRLHRLHGKENNNPKPKTQNPKLYRTGDLARWLDDGTVEFLGRIDHQVKIRGFRIELGEIETRLLKHEAVKDVVVSAKQEGEGDAYLCAYVASSQVTAEELKKYLSGSLPNYMVPTTIIILEKMPLNPNGKIDLKALPEPRKIVSSQDHVAPRDEIDRKLVDVWRHMLNVEEIGIHDSYFDIGGHSLKALQLVNAIKKEFNVEINIQDIFQYPTIAELSDLIKKKEKTEYLEIELQPEKDYYELSYSQKRLWFLYQFDPDSPGFNLPAMHVFHEKVDENIVRKVLELLVERHESFRTYFKIVAGNPVQVILPEIPVNLEYIDISHLEEKPREEESFDAFKLENPPLFRVKLVKKSEEEYHLILVMHHMISDGWSLDLLVNEFSLLYESYKIGNENKLEPLRLRYRDYVYWNNRLLSDEAGMKAAKDFWESRLKGGNAILELPYDFSRKELDSKESAGYRCVVPGLVIDRLRKIAKERQASLFMVMLAGFDMLLSRLTGQTDIIMGIPGAARQHEDLKNIVGLFVNTLILVDHVNPDEPFIDFLTRVQYGMVRVLDYQSYPLELICSEYKIPYPEISVFFNMSTFGDVMARTLEDETERHIETVQDAKFDIVCYLGEYKNGIEIETHYYKKLFNSMTIQKIMQMYLTILDSISMDPGKKVAEYSGTRAKKRINIGK